MRRCAWPWRCVTNTTISPLAPPGRAQVTHNNRFTDVLESCRWPSIPEIHSCRRLQKPYSRRRWSTSRMAFSDIARCSAVPIQHSQALPDYLCSVHSYHDRMRKFTFVPPFWQSVNYCRQPEMNYFREGSSSGSLGRLDLWEKLL